jgi:hypothetical protein
MKHSSFWRSSIALILTFPLVSVPPLTVIATETSSTTPLPLLENTSQEEAPFILETPSSTVLEPLAIEDLPVTPTSTVLVVEELAPLEILVPSSSPPLVATSTEPLLDETPTPSSTEPSPTPPPVLEPPPSTPPPEPPPPPLLPSPEAPTEDPPMICLAMIAPYPEEGREWIAFYGLTPSSSHRLLDWSIADAQSSLVKISPSTPLLWDEATQTLRYELKSARLNNDGDSVVITRADGSLHEHVTYTKTTRGEVWRRTSCESDWQIASTAPPELPEEALTEEAPTMTIEWVDLPPLYTPIEETPLAAASPTQSPEATPLASTATKPAPPPTTPPPTPSPSSVPTSATVTTPLTTPLATSTALLYTAKTSAATKSSTMAKASTTTKATKPPAPAKTSTAKKTASSSKGKTPSAQSPVIPLVSMDTLLREHETRNGVRVRLTGLVGNAPKLVGAQKFVLLNPDGKGLLVQGTSKQPSPVRGTVIELTGTLSWNDSGILLKQGAQDTWTAIGSTEEEAFPLRDLPLPAPALEDGWSHTEIEGTVQEIRTSSLLLDTSKGDVVQITLPKALGYRAGRLQKGDVIRVRGLYDPRQETVALLPQRAQDITTLTRAPIAAAQATLDTPMNTQPWLPLGIVGGTLLATEGWRRSHKLRQRAYERTKLLLRKTPVEQAS